VERSTTTSFSRPKLSVNNAKSGCFTRNESLPACSNTIREPHVCRRVVHSRCQHQLPAVWRCKRTCIIGGILDNCRRSWWRRRSRQFQPARRSAHSARAYRVTRMAIRSPARAACCLQPLRCTRCPKGCWLCIGDAARLPGGYRPIAVTRYALALLSRCVARAGTAGCAAATSFADSYQECRRLCRYVYIARRREAGVTSENEHSSATWRLANRVEQAGRDSFLVKHPDFALFRSALTRKRCRRGGVHGANWWTN